MLHEELILLFDRFLSCDSGTQLKSPGASQSLRCVRLLGCGFGRFLVNCLEAFGNGVERLNARIQPPGFLFPACPRADRFGGSDKLFRRELGDLRVNRFELFDRQVWIEVLVVRQFEKQNRFHHRDQQWIQLGHGD